ncbi:MAG: hypothetical protein WCS28_12335 [Thiomicrospira sp.]
MNKKIFYVIMATALAGFVFTGLSAQAQTSTDYKAAAQSMLDSFKIGVSNCSQATIDAAVATVTSIQSKVSIIAAQIAGLNSNTSQTATNTSQTANSTFGQNVPTLALQKEVNVNGVPAITAPAPTYGSNGNLICANTGQPVYLSYLSWSGTQATTCCDPNDGIKPAAYPKFPNVPADISVNAKNTCLYPIDAPGGICVKGWNQTCGNGVCGTGEDRCNCPQDCIPTSPKTCVETCKDMGWGSGYCDSYTRVFGVEDVYQVSCMAGNTQLANNFSSDCKLTTGLTDEGRECCCVAKPARKCIEEGKGITPFVELPANASYGLMHINYRQHIENEKCCAGLVAVKNSRLHNGRCVSTGPAINMSLNVQPKRGEYLCTKCGNGVCGTGENQCNCPADCK